MTMTPHWSTDGEGVLHITPDQAEGGAEIPLLDCKASLTLIATQMEADVKERGFPKTAARIYDDIATVADLYELATSQFRPRLSE